MRIEATWKNSFLNMNSAVKTFQKLFHNRNEIKIFALTNNDLTHKIFKLPKIRTKVTCILLND